MAPGASNTLERSLGWTIMTPPPKHAPGDLMQHAARRPGDAPLEPETFTPPRGTGHTPTPWQVHISPTLNPIAL